MKQLILILMLSLVTTGYTQLSPPVQKIDLHLPTVQKYGYEGTIKTGPAVMIGGAAFIVAGLLTPPTYVAGSTTEKKPFYQQIRNLPLLTGSLVFTTGFVITLTGN